MNRDRGDAIAGADDGFDALFAEVVPHEIVADQQKLRRHEPDLVATAQEHRVLGREPQSAIDRDETVVRANLDASHRAAHSREHGLGPLAQPLVLRPPRHIPIQARHIQRRDAVARLQAFDRHRPARSQTHRRPSQHAVGPRTRATRPASPRARPSRPRTARAGAAGTRAARAAAAATGAAPARRTATGTAPSGRSCGGATRGPGRGHAGAGPRGHSA